MEQTKPKKKYLIKGKIKTKSVVVLGEVNVGKSNIVRRLLGQEYEELEATIGVEFGYIEANEVDNKDPSITLSVQIWDTSGAERYRAITTRYIKRMIIVNKVI